jgi:hypothetical protein
VNNICLKYTLQYLWAEIGHLTKIKPKNQFDPHYMTGDGWNWLQGELDWGELGAVYTQSTREAGWL